MEWFRWVRQLASQQAAAKAAIEGEYAKQVVAAVGHTGATLKGVEAELREKLTAWVRDHLSLFPPGQQTREYSAGKLSVVSVSKGHPHAAKVTTSSDKEAAAVAYTLAAETSVAKLFAALTDPKELQQVATDWRHDSRRAWLKLEIGIDLKAVERDLNSGRTPREDLEALGLTVDSRPLVQIVPS
jgi:hypothetical protein